MKHPSEVDVVVIGSGAGGSAVLRQLSDKGLNVLCLEQGSYINYGTLPANYLDWQTRGQKSLSPFHRVRESSSDLAIDDSNSPIKIANFSGVGGSTLLYSGHYPRFHESDFKTKSLDGFALDWPISYFDLEPYYEQNRKFTPVSGLEGDPVYPLIKSLLPPVPLGLMGEKIAHGFNKLGWHWWPSYSAIATAPFKNHGVCINLGTCNLGCPQQAKSSSDLSHLKDSINQGIELKVNSRVVRISLDNNGKLSGVYYLNKNNELIFQPSKIVVISCGGVGTPQLLLNSKTNSWPTGIANRSGQVGKNLMLHPLGYVEGLFSEDLQSNFGPQGSCIASHEFYRSQYSGETARGFTMQIIRGPHPVESAKRWYDRGNLRWGNSHHHEFKKLFNHTAHISIIMEDPPSANNSITSTSNKEITESVFLAPAKVNYQLDMSVVKSLKVALDLASQVLYEAGAKKVIKFAPVRDAGWHILGTARMGHDPSTSVVDSYGECHDVSNLFIADSSVFVTSASVNPAATIHALGLRTGNRILARFGLLNGE